MNVIGKIMQPLTLLFENYAGRKKKLKAMQNFFRHFRMPVKPLRLPMKMMQAFLYMTAEHTILTMTVFTASQGSAVCNPVQWIAVLL